MTATSEHDTPTTGVPSCCAPGRAAFLASVATDAHDASVDSPQSLDLGPSAGVELEA